MGKLKAEKHLVTDATIFSLCTVLVIIFLLTLTHFFQKNYSLILKKEAASGSPSIPKSPYIFVRPGMVTKDVVLHVTDESVKPAFFQVGRNDIVKISFIVDEGYHNFILPEFGIYSEKLTQGNSDTFAFVATESGRFSFKIDDGRYAVSPIGEIIVK